VHRHAKRKATKKKQEPHTERGRADPNEREKTQGIAQGREERSIDRSWGKKKKKVRGRRAIAEKKRGDSLRKGVTDAKKITHPQAARESGGGWKGESSGARRFRTSEPKSQRVLRGSSPTWGVESTWHKEVLPQMER